MNSDHTIFSGKLREIERESEQFLRRFQVLSHGSHEDICRELEQTALEWEEIQFSLERQVRESHSPVLRALSDAQLSYYQRIYEIWKQELPRSFHPLSGDQPSPGQDLAEAAALYAEYAVDLAAQSIRYALLAAMSAIDLQMSQEEKENSYE